MLKIVKMPIADWLPYPPPLYTNIGYGLRRWNRNNPKMDQNLKSRISEEKKTLV